MTERNNDSFEKLTERLLSGPPNTPEESAQFKAEREAARGTMWEWAQMQDDGVIGVRSSGYDIDGSHGIGEFTVSPNDEDYEQAKKQYGLNKPGDTFHVTKKLVSGEWIVQTNETDAAKST